MSKAKIARQERKKQRAKMMKGLTASPTKGYKTYKKGK